MLHKNKHNGLILAGLAGLMLVIGLLVSNAGRRDAMLVESPVTRQSVEASLERLLPAVIETARDEALLSAAKSLPGEPYVSRVWVIDPGGRIVFHEGGPGQVGDEVRQVAGRDGRSLVASLSADEFSAQQAVQVYTAAALLAEGEHNDVFRPLVRPLRNADGSLVGTIGLTYDVSPEVANPSAGEIVRTALFLLGLGVYWLALPLWVLLDARLRGEPAMLWSVFVLASNLVGLLAYLIVIGRNKSLLSH